MPPFPYEVEAIERAAQARRVVLHFLERRADGDPVTVSDLVEEDRGLMPELARELQKLKMIQHSRRLADTDPRAEFARFPTFQRPGAVTPSANSARNGRYCISQGRKPLGPNGPPSKEP